MASHMQQYSAFNLPPELEPLSAWAYVGYSILYAIPVIGFIFLIVFSISDKNINRRNFSRSYFCVMILTVVLIVVLALTGLGAEFFSGLQDGSVQQQVVETTSNVIGA